MKKPISLYVHIPFCVKKCNYCDFLSAPADDAMREAYVKALIKEIEGVRLPFEKDRVVTTVFFGGGTPSVLFVSQTERILKALQERFRFSDPGPEISMELNPGTVTKEQCVELCKLGINRFSIGLQSPDDAALRRLGRIHTYRQFLDTYAWLREAGCKNINIDLMSALPGQSVSDYCEGLHKVAGLSPEHISAYSLILEEGTPLYARYQGKSEGETGAPEEMAGKTGQPEDEAWRLPDEEEERKMYRQTREILESYGYHRYEISNYAKEGFECRHNCVYWERGEYLGLGLGAASLIGEERLKNTAGLHNYIDKSPEAIEERIPLSVREQMEEFLFLGLRMMRGISKQRFRETFGRDVEEIFGPVIEKYVKMGLLSEEADRIALTDAGIDVSNVIFADFLEDP